MEGDRFRVIWGPSENLIMAVNEKEHVNGKRDKKEWGR